MQPQPHLHLYDRAGEPQASGPGAPSGDPVRRARDRLARAVTMLEGAAESVDARCRRQQREVDAARAEAEALRESQSALAKRLDAAIGRLRGILGE